MLFKSVWTAVKSDSSPIFSPAEIQILITVTPVNEFDPQIAGPLVQPSLKTPVVLVMNAVDGDWPFNSLRLAISGGDSGFTIDQVGGEIIWIIPT